MGVLTAAGALGHDGGTPPDPEIVNDPAGSAEPEVKTDEKPIFIPESKLTESKKPGRRPKLDEEVTAKLGAWEADQKKEREEYRKLIAEQREQIARLSGQVEAVQRMPPPAPVPAPPASPDPADLRRQAREALDANKFDDYERLRDQAAEIIADRKAETRVKAAIDEIRGQIPQPVHPAIAAMLAVHKNVAMAGERGTRAVMIKDAELDLYGMPPGPERVRKAFELADAALAAKEPAPPPRFDIGAAGSLAGVPASRNAGAGAQEPGVTLTPLEMEYAKNARMTPAEYARWKNPEKYVRKS